MTGCIVAKDVAVMIGIRNEVRKFDCRYGIVIFGDGRCWMITGKTLYGGGIGSSIKISGDVCWVG